MYCSVVVATEWLFGKDVQEAEEKVMPQAVLKITPTGAYRALHALADDFEPSVRKAFIAAVEKLRGSVTLKELQEAISLGNAERVIELLGWNQFNSGLREMTELLREEIIDAAKMSGGQLIGVVGNDFSFDVLNPMSASYIRQYEFDLIREITDETREAVRAIVLDAFEEGGHPYQQARDIRMLIGLTERQMNAVSNYWDMLIESGTVSSRAEELAMQYYGRLLNSRARTIARTETIRAAGQGRELLWRQAVAEGLLDPYLTRRQWLVTPDDRACIVCQSIADMNPNGVRLNESFRSESGPLDQEPAHPNCRCSVILSTIE